MTQATLTPVFVGLRAGLHALFVILTVVVIARAALAPTDNTGAVVGMCVVLLATYAFGAVLTGARRPHTRSRLLVWLAILTVEWAVLLWLTPEAAYLAFPLFYLYLHLLGKRWGSIAVVACTGVTVCALG
ncbi:MAG: sensor histidine kinase, partial [bacterium]|nr:sensor histidine kinase [bacterium]